MKLTFVEPRAELKPYIKSIWVFESPVGMPLSAKSIAVPNGCPKIIINFENSIISIVGGKTQESKEHGFYFAGNRDVPVQLTTPESKTGFIGIEFNPHGAYSIFGIPMFETVNNLLPADVLLEKGESNFNEVLINKESIKDKIDFIQERFILRIRKKKLQNPLTDYCVNTLKSTDGLIEISELERRTGYSRRYLEMLFKKHIGFTPKVLAGIFRFQKFYSGWAQGKTYEELKDQMNNFYFDQAHFIKEFKKMTGFSPQKYTNEVKNEFGKQLAQH